MPLVRHALAAAAGACLLGGAALAADAPKAPVDSPPPPAAQTGTPADASATLNGAPVQTIASQPVPDTPENRAKYGQPMSRAGKRTKPTGD